MKRSRPERRKPIICPHCQKEMVCMRHVEPISNLTKARYIWYVCPRRSKKKEQGCGYISLVHLPVRTKQPAQTAFSLKYKKLK